jgi:hypothetical protein
MVVILAVVAVVLQRLVAMARQQLGELVAMVLLRLFQVHL